MSTRIAFIGGGNMATSLVGGLIAEGTVPASIIEDYGAVSEPVATAMVRGALRYSHADFAIAVTGVAGPGGGSAEKPVGTVWVAVASAEQQNARLYQFDGERDAVRAATLIAALELLLGIMDPD